MPSDLTIQYLGGRSPACAALAKMRERGLMVSRTAVQAAFGPRNPSPACVVMSGGGGHLVAAISRTRSTKPWIALLNDQEVERMRPSSGGGPARSWFRRLMYGADAVVLPSDTALAAWKRWVPESSTRVFRIYPAGERALNAYCGRGELRSPIKVSVLSEARDTPRLGAFASVLEVFRQRCPELRSALEVSIRGAMNREDRALAERLELNIEEPQSPLGELVVVLDRGEGLPGDFFTALHSGRPVLSLSRSEEAARILAKTGLGLQIECGQRGWAERGAAVLQRAVFRRSLRRSLLPEYSPRPGALSDFSVEHFSSQLEKICYELLSPKLLGPPKLPSQFGDRQPLS